MAMRVAQNCLLILLGAALLLAPAIVWGRPFVFFDTPAYWGWGRDIVEALAQPWPHPGQAWISGRSLHGWEIGAHGASPADLRFTLTLLPARPAFYAVPVYLLASVGGLWLIAALQALVVAWVLLVAVRALIPGVARWWTYLGAVAALSTLSALGLEAGYIMPDVFGGLAILAAALLMAKPDAIGPFGRIGLGGVAVYAALAHTANGLDLAAALICGLVLFGGDGVSKAVARVGPVAAVLGLSLMIAIAGQAAPDRGVWPRTRRGARFWPAGSSPTGLGKPTLSASVRRRDWPPATLCRSGPTIPNTTSASIRSCRRRPPAPGRAPTISCNTGSSPTPRRITGTGSSLNSRGWSGDRSWSTARGSLPGESPLARPSRSSLASVTISTACAGCSRSRRSGGGKR